MKKITMKVSLFVFAGMLSMGAAAQQKPTGTKKFGKPVLETSPCGTVEYEALLQKRNPNRDSKEQFEQWIAPKAALEKMKRLQKDGNTSNEVVTIPVVFHIIHNGSPVGTAENIAADQIQSQIDVLNEDFRRLAGSNGFNNNPVGADMEINFCLAKQDSDGILSTGIIRYNLGDGDGWSMEEVEVIKAQTQWNPEKYLNIWVLDEIYGLAGYAQFPTDSGLEGIDDLEGLPSDANTDGVALGHQFVGSQEKFPAGVYDETRNQGRTASHEIGHFFGLRHIWGDSDDCSTADDFCADTPTALAANYGCQIGLDSCPDNPGDDMIENYMDYTDDACLNVFTQNQKDRMQAVLANSPRRHSLITSTGCIPGIVLENDGSLQINEMESACGETIIEPEVVLTNTGSVALTLAAIAYHADNQADAVYNWAGNLAPNQSVTITLPQISLTTGNHTLYTSINTVNGVEDIAPSNDTKSLAFSVAGTFTTAGLKVTITTDDYGDETLWGIGTMESEEMIAGNFDPEDFWNSDFYDDNETYIINVPITEAGCYGFFIYDLEGDGMCCEYGEGHYKVETAEGVLIAEGGQFTETEEKMFAIELPTGGLDDITKTNSIKLYPNPANSILNIVANETDMPENYAVYNSLGQLIDSGKVTSTLHTLNISKYANGVYFINLSKGEGATTLQFIKY
jgi:hypothetical protein